MHRASKRSFRVVAAAATLVVLAATPAAGQLDPRDEPTVSGPLNFGERVCNREALKAPDGKIGVVTRACIYAYTFDSGEETDAERDYGVAWVQTYAEPKNGWCLSRVKSDVINQNDNISAKAPRVNRTFSRGRRFVTRLRSDANGAANTDGIVRNAVRMRPGRLRSVNRDGGKTFRLVWSGATARPVAFTVGIESNWNSSGEFVFSPTGGVRTTLKANC